MTSLFLSRQNSLIILEKKVIIAVNSFGVKVVELLFGYTKADTTCVLDKK